MVLLKIATHSCCHWEYDDYCCCGREIQYHQKNQQYRVAVVEAPAAWPAFLSSSTLLEEALLAIMMWLVALLLVLGIFVSVWMLWASWLDMDMDASSSLRYQYLPAKCRHGHALLLLLASAGESSVDLMVSTKESIWNEIPCSRHNSIPCIPRVLTVHCEEEWKSQRPVLLEHLAGICTSLLWSLSLNGFLAIICTIILFKVSLNEACGIACRPI